MKTTLKVVAVLMVFFAIVGFWSNIRFMQRGQGMPAEPAARRSFVVGMFVCPSTFLAGAVVCGALAWGGRRR